MTWPGGATVASRQTSHAAQGGISACDAELEKSVYCQSQHRAHYAPQLSTLPTAHTPFDALYAHTKALLTMPKHSCLPRVKGKGALKRKATEAARVQLPFRPPSTTANTSPDTATPSPPSPLVPQEEEEEEIILDVNDHASLVDPPAAVPAESEDDPHQEDSEKLSDDDVDGNNPIPGRPRKATSIILSEEVERDLGEWLEHEVPYVYTKGHKDHMDRAKVGINLLLLALV